GDVLTMGYDANNNRTSVQDNFGGLISRVYNGDNELVTIMLGGSGVTPLRADLTYTPDGQISGITRYSNLAGTTEVATTSYTYDTANGMTHLQDKDSSGGNLAKITYTLDSTTSRLDSEQRDGGAV